MASSAGAAWNVSPRARDLHARAHVLDLLMPWLDYEGFPPERRYDTLRRLAESGCTFVSLTLALDDANVDRVIRSIARHRAYVLARPERFVLVERADDISRAKAEGRLAIGFHFQGTEPVQRNLEMVEVYYKLGIRQMLIAYNQKNSAGDGCHEPEDSGLTRYGRALVREMNRTGMLVDVSHTGYRTAIETIEASESPAIFSHSNPRALFDHERNIPDELVRACAARGGVIGLNGCGAFLGNNDISTATLVRHIDHHVQLVGATHVGLGLDYVYDQESWHRYITGTSVGHYLAKDYLGQEEIRYVAPEQLPEVTEGLLGLGYAEADVEGILGGNWLRLMRAVWK